MTDNTMREAMIDQGGAVWEEIGGAWSMYWPAQSVSVVGEPLTCDECGAATDDPWHSSESGSRHFHRCDACHTAALEAQRVPVVGEPDCYDAGLLGDFGGGNVKWWQDYIRAELARAHDFYASQWPVAIPAAELATLREKAAEADELQKREERMQKALSDIAEWTDRYTTPGHPVSTIARAAIAQGKGEK